MFCSRLLQASFSMSSSLFYQGYLALHTSEPLFSFCFYFRAEYNHLLCSALRKSLLQEGLYAATWVTPGLGDLRSIPGR